MARDATPEEAAAAASQIPDKRYCDRHGKPVPMAQSYSWDDKRNCEVPAGVAFCAVCADPQRGPNWRDERTTPKDTQS